MNINQTIADQHKQLVLQTLKQWRLELDQEQALIRQVEFCVENNLDSSTQFSEIDKIVDRTSNLKLIVLRVINLMKEK